jgi:ABC-type nickel/cobalt efflux system permease component RcnA
MGIGNLAVYVTALSIGMLHGIEPGHGWPVAASLAMNHRRRMFYGLCAALIIASAHLVSSFAVVALYALLDHAIGIANFRWLNIISGGLLLLMAIHQWRSVGSSHHHGHNDDRADHHHRVGVHQTHGQKAHEPVRKKTPDSSLLGLVGFAFALGFAHEEEFAIIALSAGRASAWLVMTVYALAVAASLVMLTALAIAAMNRFEGRFSRHQKLLPRVSAIILGVMGVAYLFRLI